MADHKVSSYKARGKVPVVYSATYQMWRKAVIANDGPKAREMACHHMKQFGFTFHKAYEACSQGD